MIGKQEIADRANKALAEEFEIEISNISSGANIKETLDLDSLGLVDMVALVETMFGVKIPAQEVTSIVTFENLYDFIYKKLN
ncbi:MAG: phosphopantetheine-binding protein [Prevotellaceae bacterium]|jgi:acyl carrier protein|nr:phosphopantetheine-binding protein [Prevotellaceae bacterium]